MGDYFEPPKVYDWRRAAVRPAVFLAGGITNCPDWQAEALEMIRDTDRDVDVLSPRRADFPIDDPDAGWDQVCWEQHHLHISRMHTLFWFPACDPALTTQPIAMFEFGQALGEGRPITVGADPGYPRARDVEMMSRLNMPDLVVHRTLRDTVHDMLSRSDWTELSEERS